MSSTGSTPAMTKQQAQFTTASRGVFSLYKDLVVGSSASFTTFCWYELCTLLFGNIPGIIGLGARAICYPTLFSACKARPGLGKGMILRMPAKISLGAKILIDDYASLDVRGEDSAIILGDHVTVGRFSTLAAKGGIIELASGVNVGSYCRVATQSRITIGESTLIAAYAYIGPGNHQHGDSETPLIAQEMEIKGGVTIGSQVWIGTRATILDGVTIGNNAIVGAHALVREDVPAGAIVAGTPAKIIGNV